MKEGYREYNREKEIAQILLQKNIVQLDPKRGFIFSSGIKSPIYCDNRMLLSYSAERDKIIDGFMHIIAQKAQDFDIIAGVATAGIPWASIIADRLEKPLIYVRSKPKEHGKRNKIEGKIEPGQRVLVIEDLISAGGSSLEAIEGLREAKANVTQCIAIFSYEMQKTKHRFQEAACELIALTGFSVLVQEAKILNIINTQEQEKVYAWQQNPEQWEPEQ